MRQRLNGDERLCAKLIPTFSVGCKRFVLSKFPRNDEWLRASRFTPGEGYLEALIEPNVTVVTDEIAQITESGILTVEGEHVEVDAIVCATGFECSHRPPFSVIGRDGRDLAEYWKDEPLHYMSVAAPGFPNYFSMYNLDEMKS